MNKVVFLISFFSLSFHFFCVGQKLIINNIIIKGNKKTKDQIVFRELTFKINDTISNIDMEIEINRSRENLLNTSLFNYVTITFDVNQSQFSTVTILVDERWYIWPSITLNYADRNFSAWIKNGDISKSNYGIAIDRNNFRGCNENLKFALILGYEKQISISYKNIALDIRLWTKVILCE